MAGAVLPGTMRVVNASGTPMYDKKGHPLWKMPNPARYVRHFVSASVRRVFELTGVMPPKGHRLVPIYRGVDARVASKSRYNIKRAKAGRWTN